MGAAVPMPTLPEVKTALLPERVKGEAPAGPVRPVGPRAPVGPVEVEAKIRSRDPGAPAVATVHDDGRIEVRFARPVRAVTPGQAVVFYAGEEVLGGAWIEGAMV